MKAALALLFVASSALAQQQDPFPLPPKDWPKPVPDTQLFSYILLDRFEYRAQKGKDLGMWDVQGWFGADYNKFWFKSEGEKEFGGRTENGEFQALYARRISPFWHLQTGVRREMRPLPERTTAVIAAQGLAPYWFNVEAMAFIGNGRLSGRVEAEYDQLLTQRLILQPRAETVFATSSDPERGLGRGVNHVELGIRLRYEIRREFAPYIGINWTRRIGETADLARAQGRDASETAIVLGVRVWY